AATVPPWHKILGLKEKYLLKKAMSEELPPEITARVKQPYMAPDSNSFTQPDSPSYVDEMLSETALTKTGIFKPNYVSKLKAKCARLSHAHLSFKDNMSFIGILSTQLFTNQFISDFKPPTALPRDNFKVWRVNKTRN
ncbi:MAG: asparagine synthase-related protein, partial [candidate division Zixibacteria bacterium]